MNKEKDITPEKIIKLRKNMDFSDIPGITDFSEGHLRNPEYFKPKKEQVSIRFNKVLLAHFRSKGKGWQSEINDFLMTAYIQGEI